MFSLDYGKKWYITHPWLLFQDIRRNIRWAWQRVFRGWDDRDLWSIDYRICVLMEQWLDKFIEVSISYPADFNHPDEWTDILIIIRDGFIAGKKIANNDYDSPSDVEREHEIYMATFDEGMSLFQKHFFNLWS